MDLDRLYKLSKTLVMFSLAFLILSASVHVWKGKGCRKFKGHRGCGYHKEYYGHHDYHGDMDVEVFEWDSDSGEVDVKAILKKSGVPGDLEAEIHEYLEKEHSHHDKDGNKKVMKKVKVWVVDEE